MLRRCVMLMAFAGLLLRFQGMAQEDLPGSMDHPLFSRMPNFFIDGYEVKDYDAAKFIVEASSKASTCKTISLEGKKTVIHYVLAQGGSSRPSKLQVVRNYTNAAKKVGGTIVFDGGGKDWTNTDDGGMYTLWNATMKFKKADGEIWATLDFDGSFLEPDLAYWLTIVEKTEMQQDVMASDDMLKVLNTLGRVSLHINFDTGKSTIKDDSAPLLEQIEKLLKENTGLKLSIEGHTDNVGAAKANQKLSEDRAQSVMQTLVKRGIAANRLSAKGFGQTKPIESNDTEEGRAQNRRVDLVKVQ